MTTPDEIILLVNVRSKTAELTFQVGEWVYRDELTEKGYPSGGKLKIWNVLGFGESRTMAEKMAKVKATSEMTPEMAWPPPRMPRRLRLEQSERLNK